MKMYARAVAGVAVMLALATPAWASLMADEYFEYSGQSHIIGQNGGSGWSGAWTLSGGSADIVAGYRDGWLTNTAYPFVPMGGFVRNDNPFHWPQRNFATPLDLAVDTNYYFSFLIAVYEQTDDNNHMEFLTNGATANIRVGLRNNAGALAARVVLGGGTQGLLNGQHLRTNYFFVGKIEASAAGQDFMRLNVYKDGDTVPMTEPGSWNVSSAGANMSGHITGIRLRKGGANAGQDLPALYDDLRFGTTWQAVAVPEPVGLGVVVVALGLLRRRG